jgi:hypothetical protein
LTKYAGKAPKGWLGPYLAQSNYSLDLLKEARYSYVMDWPADDQPFWMSTRAGAILSVPYPVEMNDSPSLVFRQHTAREFEEMIIDQFDEMLRRSQRYPLVFSIAVHPFIIGQPFRMRALRRALDHILKRRENLWITTPGEIASYCAKLPASILPGPSSDDTASVV